MLVIEVHTVFPHGVTHPFESTDTVAIMIPRASSIWRKQVEDSDFMFWSDHTSFVKILVLGVIFLNLHDVECIESVGYLVIHPHSCDVQGRRSLSLNNCLLLLEPRIALIFILLVKNAKTEFIEWISPLSLVSLVVDVSVWARGHLRKQWKRSGFRSFP